MERENPYLIEFPRIGNSGIGYISVGEVSRDIPFEVKRCFWTYYTPDSIVRGRHTHHECEQVLIAVSGRIILNTESITGKLETFHHCRPESVFRISVA